MKFAVIGAGSVGGAFAVALARDGHQVTVTARGDHLEQIRNHGLRMAGDFGEFTAGLRAERMLPDEHYDLVLLCVKAQDSASAIHENYRVLGRAPILVVQNGLGSIDDTRALLTEAHIAGGLAGLATSLAEPGEVNVTRLSTTYIGNERDPDFAQTVVQLLAPSIPVEFLDNFSGALWTKLVVNCLNGFPAITGLSMQELTQTPLMEVAAMTMQEAVRVALSHGMHFAPLMGLNHEVLVQLLEQNPDEAAALPRELIARFGSTPNYGSTLQSIQRGRPTEIEQLNGAIVSRANGLPTPINSTIVELVHHVEQHGFLSVNAAFTAFGAHFFD